jgi:hypothetical protein
LAVGLLYLAGGRVQIIGHDKEAQTPREFWDA